MFLIGLFGLAAMGGAAYALGDVLAPEDEEEDDRIEESAVDDLSEGDFLDIDENIEDPAPPEEAETGEVVSDHGGHLVIAGGHGADILTGQDGNDQINGYGGNDVIDGGAGNDVLYGGDGADVMTGSTGDDLLHGEDGDDDLAGMSGEDDLYGHFGADTLDGGHGDDRLYGGQGDDSLSGGDGDDALQGGAGADHLAGGAGSDALFGGDGDDILTGDDGPGEASTDFLNGGAGDDVILAGPGDVVTGGEGEDEIVLQAEPDQEATTITDFRVGHDKLLITWDSAAEPDVAIETDSENDSLTHVRVNGEDVAHLHGATGLTADDIQFVTEAYLAQYAPAG